MKFSIDLKIFVIIILFYISKQIEIYALVMLFAIIHELAHLSIGILLGFKPEKLKIIPVGLTVSFKVNLNDYNERIRKANLLELKKIIIAIAGPAINIIIAIMTYELNLFPNLNKFIVLANLFIAIFNLIPIYPLDGGRILKGVLHIIFGKWKAKKYINDISICVMIVITAIASVGIYYFKNIAFLIIIAYLWIIVLKENMNYKKQLNIYKVIKTIENN